MSNTPETMILVSRETLDEYWRQFAKKGIRHAQIARWVYVLKWTIGEKAMRDYLAPEMETIH